MNLINFETDKLFIQNPDLNNIIILLLLLLIAGGTVRKNKTKILDRLQTNQLKGVAILFVVTRHLWTHVSFQNAVPNFAATSVALFLLLSGYGLTRSWFTKPMTFTEFITRRVNRVMVPYWIATLVIVVVDYLVLGKLYSTEEIVSTMVGINFQQSLRYLDYARWYITLLLLFYAAFFVFNRMSTPRNAVVSLFICGLFLFFLRRIDWFPFGALYQFIAFPLGCFTGYHYEKIMQVFSKRQNLFGVVVLSVAGIIFCNILLSWQYQGYLAKVIDTLAANGKPLFYCILILCIVAVLGFYGMYSYFFAFCGNISYEIYLIHGPLLIKYNVIFGFFSTDYVVFSFLVLLLVILLLSYFFKMFHTYLTSPKNQLVQL